MVASFRIATTSSIIFTLITITVQFNFKKIKESDWKEIPVNLRTEIPRLFEEFEQKDSDMKKLAEDSDVKEPKGISFAEVEAYPEGPFYNFVTIKFDTRKKVDTNGSNDNFKYVVVLVLGRINYKHLKLDIYYLITGGKAMDCNKLGFVNAQEEASKTAIAALNLECGPGTVVWHENVWKDMEEEMKEGSSSKEKVKTEIKNRLRLQSTTISVNEMDITHEAFGSIQFETETPCTLRVAVYRLNKKSNAFKGLQNKAKAFLSIGCNMFSVVLDKRSTGIKVLYTSTPTLSMSAACVDAEIFAMKYVIWNTDKNEQAGFEKLKTIRKNLHYLVDEALIRKQILQNHLVNYMTNERTSFQKIAEMNRFIELVLDGSAGKSEIPPDLALSMDQADSEIKKLGMSRPRLEYLKFNNLLTTDTFNKTLYWFEIHHNSKILQCIVRATTTFGSQNGEPKLEITDIFQDKEHFSVQTRNSMLEEETFTTNQIPLFYHSSKENVIRPTYYENPVALYNTFGQTDYLPKIREAMKMAEIKGDLLENSCVLSNEKFASWPNSNLKNGVESGMYFTAKFSDDPTCYTFCMIQAEHRGVNFIFPEGSALYDTEEEAIDAMYVMLKAKAF